MLQLENEATIKPVTTSSQQRSQYTETQHILNRDPKMENALHQQTFSTETQLDVDTQNDANSNAETTAQSQAEAEAEANALAQTAAKVLDSVSENTSQKFRQSTFLGLMRKLRDGEATVKGDDIVDVVNGSSSSTGSDYARGLGDLSY